jgi:iron complex transport system substrate-binding protein
MRALIPILALATAGCTAPAAPPPVVGKALRIASINPCVDAVLARVADPRTIAAISHYSLDPAGTSVSLDWARRFRSTSGTAEELVALQPDVVIGGAGTDPSTAQALRRLGIRLVEYNVPETVADSVAQVREIAAIAHQPARGEALVRQIEAAARPDPVARKTALIWRDGGLVLGTGTLADALLTSAGFRNMSATYGLGKWGVLPMETMIAAPPQVLLSTGAAEAADGRGDVHPAIRRLGTRIRLVPFSGRLMNCGGPSIIDAMARLRAIRRQVAA